MLNELASHAHSTNQALKRAPQPQNVVILYLGFSVAWIVLSDIITHNFFGGEVSTLLVGLFKGLVFVSVTAGLIYYLVQRDYRKLHQAQQSVVQSYDATLEAWVRLLDMRDANTHDHSQRTQEMAISLAREFGFTGLELENVRRGALLHDLGKMAIPDKILQKREGLLPEEMIEIRKHPLYAKSLMEKIEFLKPAMEIPLYHHERWDGKGYPYGLKGDQIPLSARIFAVVDVWDALTSDRPYHFARDPERALEIIRQGSGTQFDPQVVDVFLRQFGPSVSRLSAIRQSGSTLQQQPM